MVTLDGQPVLYNATPKLHGVTYDRYLTFSCHATLVGNSLRRQTGALQKLAFTSLEYDRPTISATYTATRRSMVEYGASSWPPWISNSTLENLERSQCYTGRVRHWPASCYSCRSHPCRSERPIDKDMGNPSKYDHHGDITDDNTNKSVTCNSDPVFYTTHLKA